MLLKAPRKTKKKEAMTQEEIIQGSLLYHSVHGLCRVDQLIKQNQSGKQVLSYSLSPKAVNKMKIRFVIPSADLEISGFHPLVSLKEAHGILDYLKSGDLTAIPSNVEKEADAAAAWAQTWVLAKEILSFAKDRSDVKDQRKRQMIERSVKGLVGELSIALKLSLKEAAAKVRSSLGSPSKVNPWVLVAITNAAED